MDNSVQRQKNNTIFCNHEGSILFHVDKKWLMFILSMPGIKNSMSPCSVFIK